MLLQQLGVLVQPLSVMRLSALDRGELLGVLVDSLLDVEHRVADRPERLVLLVDATSEPSDLRIAHAAGDYSAEPGSWFASSAAANVPASSVSAVPAAVQGLPPQPLVGARRPVTGLLGMHRGGAVGR